MKKYTTKKALEEYLGEKIDGQLDFRLGEWIAGISAFIDRLANRSIYVKVPAPAENEEENEDADNGHTTHKYDGDGTGILIVDDVHDIESVLIDGAERKDDLLFYPTNKPYTSRLAFSDNEVFPRGKQNVSVTGVHAMNPVLPDDIKMACTVLVAGIYNSNYRSESGARTEKIGNYSVSYDDGHSDDYDWAIGVIKSYRRIAL